MDEDSYFAVEALPRGGICFFAALKEGEKDVTLSVITMLQDASKHKNSKVIIEKGTYHFYPEKAYEQYCFITNHDNSLRRIAFPINDFDGLIIDAKDAKFVFHGVMMPFNIENSKNINNEMNARLH